MRTTTATTTCYVNPADGALSLQAHPDWPSTSILPGLTAPVVRSCQLHRIWHPTGLVGTALASSHTIAAARGLRPRRAGCRRSNLRGLEDRHARVLDHLAPAPGENGA